MTCDVKASQWRYVELFDLSAVNVYPDVEFRLVEVGRLVLLNDGPSAGQLATIVEIIDHKRVRNLFCFVSCHTIAPSSITTCTQIGI